MECLDRCKLKKEVVAMSKKEFWLVVGVSVTSSLATLGLFLAFWGGQTVLAKDNSALQKEIRAQAFVLVDKNGNSRASLAMSSEDSSGFAIYDKNGKKTIFMGVDDKGTATMEMGRPNILFFVSADGRPLLNLLDGSRSRAVLGLWPDGDPNLTFRDKDGNRRAVLGSIEPEPSQIAIIERRPISSLVLYGGDGRAIWNTP